MAGHEKQPARVGSGRTSLAGESLARIRTVKILLFLFFLIVSGRLFQIHVIEAAKYRKMAIQQYQSTVPLPPIRGNIYDRNGKILASNSMYVTFAADPTMMKNNARKVAERFAHVFGKPPQFYLNTIQQAKGRYVALESGVNPVFRAKIKTGDFEGLVVHDEPKRLYHYGSSGSQLIGFTSPDNHGVIGVEFDFENYLRGDSGYVIMQRDGMRRLRPSVDYPRVEPSNGNHVMLTIDIEYQAIAEEELRKGVEQSEAESGLVVMMDPRTGEVLAMANYPQLSSNNPAASPQATMRNRIITDVFEPGSVFKLVTAAAALEKTIIKPDRQFFAENGSYAVRLPGGKTRTISDMKKYGRLTFQEAMELSSNIVMAKISDLVGDEDLYTMARNFGFGIPTGLQLTGEVSGELKKPNQWSATTLNSIAFGYEVSVTPIQVVAAYAAIANGGVLMRPTILKRIVNTKNEVLVETHDQTIRRVVSRKTAETLRDFFTGAVERGTGTAAKQVGINIAGKTGTSRKYIGGSYREGKYNASFAGFFPAENPQVVCYVWLENPNMASYTGGIASAPIFGAIAQKVVTTSDRFTRKEAPVIIGKELLVVPDLTNLRTDVAASLIAESGFQSVTKGEEEIVLAQIPPGGTRLARDEEVTLITTPPKGVTHKGTVRVPDLHGLSVRRAISRLAVADLVPQVEGNGVVVSQSLSAGDEVKPKSRIVLRCEPKKFPSVSLN